MRVCKTCPIFQLKKRGKSVENLHLVKINTLRYINVLDSEPHQNEKESLALKICFDKKIVKKGRGGREPFYKNPSQISPTWPKKALNGVEGGGRSLRFYLSTL